jgi:hypothetical protein
MPKTPTFGRYAEIPYVEITQMVLRTRPELLHETLRDAKAIAEALDGVWTHLDRIVQRAEPDFSESTQHRQFS